MIFVGDGALLWRAVRHAVDGGKTVDMVCTGGRATAPAGLGDLDVRTVDAIGPLGPEIHSACSDGIVWSIDNRFLFGPEVLDGDLTVYNIHGGPLPGYRGLPLATVAHAILNGESEFGATLHRVDPGIDTGPVVAVQRFPIDDEDVFEDVMVELMEACHALFTDHLDAAVDGTLVARPQPDGPSAYYGSKAVAAVPEHRDNPNYERATDLGMFADFYPDAAAAWR